MRQDKWRQVSASVLEVDPLAVDLAKRHQTLPAEAARVPLNRRDSRPPSMKLQRRPTGRPAFGREATSFPRAPPIPVPHPRNHWITHVWRQPIASALPFPRVWRQPCVLIGRRDDLCSLGGTPAG